MRKGAMAEEGEEDEDMEKNIMSSCCHKLNSVISVHVYESIHS